MTQQSPTAAEREIVVAREMNAPRELVWRAWTDPEHVAKWWGPDGFTNTIHQMDVRPGGVWLFTMHGPDGIDYPNKIVFVEVAPPERLVYDHSDSSLESDPHAFRSTATFEDLDGRTRVTLRAIFASVEARQYVIEHFGALEGGKQTLGRLAEYVEHM